MDESSHVRFQESDLDALDNYVEKNNFVEKNNNVERQVDELEAEVIKEEEEQRVYSEVCYSPSHMGSAYTGVINMMNDHHKGRMTSPKQMNFRKSSKRPLTPPHFLLKRTGPWEERCTTS